MFSRRQHTDAAAALQQQENDLECAKRAQKWGMTDSAKKWQASADQSFDDFLRITEKESKQRKK
ncbi:hypothetical protein ACIQKE_17965 [Streptomyces griseoviridis]